MTNIVEEKIRIQNNIDKWKQKLVALQEQCTHPNVEVKHRANTGNYDPMADCYWIEYKCPDCGKYWLVDV